MNNIHLFCTHKGIREKLDLYEEDTPKINLSSEDLEDFTAVTGSFTNTFRLPASYTNTDFFKYFYNYNISDFDLTVAIQAEIVVAGDIKFVGKLRLLAAYRNSQEDLIEFEVLFVGEISDFSGEVGERNLNEIGGDLSHALTIANIEESWNADPANNNGLFDGNVLYPLCEWGYNYDNNLDTNFNYIASSDVPVPNQNLNIFTNPQFPIVREQFRPFLRAKFILDTIFENTKFTFDSQFLNSQLFKSIYVNAGGNDARASMELQVTSANFIATREPLTSINSVLNEDVTAPYPVIVDDESNLWSGTQYQAPLDGNYTLQWQQTFLFTFSTTDTNCGTPQFSVDLWYKINGTKNIITTITSPLGQPTFLTSFTGFSEVLNLNIGDLVEVGYNISNVTGSTCSYTFNAEFFGGFVEILNAPIVVNPPLLLKDDFKVIDWLRSIFTKFKLVLQPKKDNPTEFIIEPFKDFIGTGTLRDWSGKIDGSKDVKIEPIFYNQSERLTFTDQEGEDFVNDTFQQRFNEVYGERIVNSNNELLKGSRTIETNFTPTPVDKIFGNVLNNMVIPHFVTRRVEDALFFDPIIANTRIVFWNGLQQAGLTWHYRDDANNTVSNTTYPLVSNYSEFPTTSNTLHLTWSIEDPVFRPGINTITDFNLLNGQDVFQKFWSDYVDSLYDNESRILEGFFLLDQDDLNLQWNDLVFIKDSWWRPIEISNANLSSKESSLVKLIKVKTVDPGICECRSFGITDLRTDISPFSFTFLDCDGVEQSAQVQQNSIVICSCTRPDLNLKDIKVTLIGSCVPQPLPVADVSTNLVATNNSQVEVDFNLQQATPQNTNDGVFTTVDTVNINPSESTGILADLDSQSYARILFEVIPPGATVKATVNFIFNDELRQSVLVDLSDEDEIAATLSTPIELAKFDITVSLSE